jgi:hypothetical protein
MPEDMWLKCEREYFVGQEAVELDITEKKLNKIIESYNKYLQKALFGDSPYVAEDMRRTIIKARGESGE